MHKSTLRLNVDGEDIDVVVVGFTAPTEPMEVKDLEDLKDIAKRADVKRIILGHVPFEILESSLADAIPKTREEPVIEFARSSLYYRPPREPESWQGKGKRRKPNLKFK